MIVVSPSKNRLDYTIDKVFDVPMEIVVEPQDAEKYNGRVGANKMVVMDANDKGFGYVMDFIVKHYYAKGERYVLFADDDIFGLKDRAGKKVDTATMIAEGEEIMKKKGYAQLMVSFSGHNWFVKDKVKEKVGCWGMIFLDVKQIMEAGGYDTRLKIFNDWDMSARLIASGRKVACWYDYKFEHKMKSKNGGAMAYYKDENFMKVQCGYMIRRYGDKIKVIFSEAHDQFEIRFNWRKL
jgi:hypothetical protein